MEEIRCKACFKRMTFAERRVQYGRLKHRQWSDGNIRLSLPRCQKCMTRFIKRWANRNDNTAQPTEGQHGSET